MVLLEMRVQEVLSLEPTGDTLQTLRPGLDAPSV